MAAMQAKRTLDLRKLFRRLKTLERNDLDDGRVIGHMNADDADIIGSEEEKRKARQHGWVPFPR